MIATMRVSLRGRTFCVAVSLMAHTLSRGTEEDVGTRSRSFKHGLPPPCGEVEKCEAFFGWDSADGPYPHPKSLRCATRFRPPHKGEVESSAAGSGRSCCRRSW